VFVLEEAYAHLVKNPLVRVEVGGHSSSDGKDDDKPRIALWRAHAVRDYLLKRGVDEKRIEVRSYGDTKPVASNDNAAGRAQNRRVEIRVLAEGAEMASSNSR
jgi:outer membrane protein OmpA-like peptidoglycan-associated protein